MSQNESPKFVILTQLSFLFSLLTLTGYSGLHFTYRQQFCIAISNNFCLGYTATFSSYGFVVFDLGGWFYGFWVNGFLFGFFGLVWEFELWEVQYWQMSPWIELEALNLLGSLSVRKKVLKNFSLLFWKFELGLRIVSLNRLLEYLMGILSFAATHMIIHAWSKLYVC